MKRLIIFVATLSVSVAVFADAEQDAFEQLKKEACPLIKDYEAHKKQIAQAYKNKLPKQFSEYLSAKSKGDNAAYLFVNPAWWAIETEKNKIMFTNPAYTVEVCNPSTKKPPTILIADWKTKKIIGTRSGFETGGWWGN